MTDLRWPTMVLWVWLTDFVRWPSSLRDLTFHEAFNKTWEGTKKAGLGDLSRPTPLFKSHLRFILFMFRHLNLVGHLKYVILKVPWLNRSYDIASTIQLWPRLWIVFVCSPELHRTPCWILQLWAIWSHPQVPAPLMILSSLLKTRVHCKFNYPVQLYFSFSFGTNS